MPIDLDKNDDQNPLQSSSGVLAQIASAINRLASAIGGQIFRSPAPIPEKDGRKVEKDRRASAAANYKPWGRYEKKPESANIEPVVKSMDDRSRKIIDHENRHSSILREGEIFSKPKIGYRQGPDGRRYAISGEVTADLEDQTGDHKKQESRAEIIHKSAMSDQKRSQSDEEAGRLSAASSQVAREGRHKESGGMKSPYNQFQPAMVSMGSPHQNGSAQVKMGAPPLVAALAGAATRFIAPAAYRVVSGAAGAFRTAKSLPGLTARATKTKEKVRLANQAMSTMPRGAPGSPQRDRYNRGEELRQKAIKQNIEAQSDLERSTRNLTKAFHQVELGTKMMFKSFGDLNDRIRNFSPPIAQQSAENLINRINQNLDHGQRLGAVGSRFERESGKLEIQIREMGANIFSIAGPIINPLIAMVSSLVQIGNGLLRMAGNITNAVTSVPGAIDNKLGGWGKWISKGFQDLLDKISPPANPNGAINMLNDLFKMQLPPPGAGPLLMGPNMKMAMPAPNLANQFGQPFGNPNPNPGNFQAPQGGMFK